MFCVQDEAEASLTALPNSTDPETSNQDKGDSKDLSEKLEKEYIKMKLDMLKTRILAWNKRIEE